MADWVTPAGCASSRPNAHKGNKETWFWRAAVLRRNDFPTLAELTIRSNSAIARARKNRFCVGQAAGLMGWLRYVREKQHHEIGENAARRHGARRAYGRRRGCKAAGILLGRVAGRLRSEPVERGHNVRRL